MRMKEVVTFFLSGKKYGVEVGQMQGIENYVDMVHAPDMPDCLLGIVTIRKEAIPVIDLKRKMVLPAVGRTPETKYVILRTSHGKLAIVADGIAKIVKAEGEGIQAFPAMMKTEATSYIEYIVKDEGDLVLTINPDEFLTNDEWGIVQKVLDDLETDGGNDD